MAGDRRSQAGGSATRRRAVLNSFGLAAPQLLTGPAPANAAQSCDGKAATVDDHPGKIVGEGGNDSICGADALTGNGGNDVVKGGAGDEELEGGADDEFRGGASEDDLVGEAGQDDLAGGGGADFCAEDGQILTACDLAQAP